jgi:uroporphyrinogen-III synthase
VDGVCDTVLVVRPRAQADAWVRELDALGVAARALPLIEILMVPDAAPVVAAFDALEAAPGEPMLVFVSPNAVMGFFRCVATVHPRVLDWPAHWWAAATGPGTVAALRDCGVPAERIAAPPVGAAQFDSEALWSTIADWSWASRRVLIVRGNGGRDWLGQQLRDAGADVQVIQSYARETPVLSADERALLDAALADPVRWIWMFSSSEAIDHLQALAPGARWHAGRALASHPRIAERATALGFGAVAIVAPSPAAVAAALAQTPGH